jgi:hypothetical protein
LAPRPLHCIASSRTRKNGRNNARLLKLVRSNIKSRHKSMSRQRPALI